jgi:mono/diheme cytochrome c family protein
MKIPDKIVISVIITVLFTGCFQGTPSEKTPIHLNPNMDDQPKYEPMEESRFFADKSSLRAPVPGTVARGELHSDVFYYLGTDTQGNFIKELPVPLTAQLLQRGLERFDIYCAPCHGAAGDGTGIVVKKGYMPPPTFHQQRLRDVTDGHIFDVIGNGIRNMPKYGHQVAVSDRWAIVAHMRALQRSQNTTLEDVPEDIQSGLK